MQELGIVLVRGIGSGAIYALIAMSLTIIYNTSTILNFAQGFWVVAAGGLAVSWLPAGVGVGGYVLGLLAVVAVIVALVSVQGVATLLPLRGGTSQHSWLVTTLAASVIIGALVERTLGSDSLNIPTVFGSFGVFGVQTSVLYLVAIVFAVVVFAALSLFYRRTDAGLAMQALRQDYDVARAAGIPARRLQIASFAIAGLILGLTGYLFGPILALSSTSGLNLVIGGFTVAIVGGLSSLQGAVLIGPLFGMATQAATTWIGADFQSAVVLGILVVVLLVVPQGLFGRPAARRV
ncbi:branched-chain amino acid ABC transporter permease [Amycolatopsis sp. NPDC005232]|uniref:branched-chain amino acid ABC transporter permease n=1 Tax=Amycolatopsis sp. NPDC005232 TaxID=3157027 RepID=UPI0033A17859